LHRFVLFINHYNNLKQVWKRASTNIESCNIIVISYVGSSQTLFYNVMQILFNCRLDEGRERQKNSFTFQSCVIVG